VPERSEFNKKIITMPITREEAIFINPSLLFISFLNFTMK
jgi:hypothetical protein